jgi:predicted MFS family arabinose efflux permease
MYSRVYKRYVTFLLLLVFIFNQADRTVMAILMEPIKREFALSDSQLGFLGGPALAVLYATLGIPVARRADRGDRVGIISIAVALWSCFAMFSGAAGTYSQLMLTRVGVGVGEAGFTAIAQSLIGDYHSSKERTGALAIFMLGIPLAGMVSTLLGGWINQGYGWRAAFIAVGLPGLILALVVRLTIDEPSHRLTATPGLADRVPLRQVFATLWHRQSQRHLVIAITLANVVVAGTLAWTPTFMIRAHGMATGELGSWFALFMGGGGGIGILVGGYLSRRIGSKDERTDVRVLSWGAMLLAPVLTAALLCPSKQGALFLLFPSYVLMFTFYAPAYSLIQALTETRMRATVLAVTLMSQALLGALGIWLLGFLSDTLTPLAGVGALRWTLILIATAAWWASAHFWIAGKLICGDLSALRERADGVRDHEIVHIPR